MVGLLEAFQYSYGRTLKCPPVSIWLNFLNPPGFRMVGLLESSMIFVWFDSKKLLPVFVCLDLSEATRYIPWLDSQVRSPVFVWLDS